MTIWSVTSALQRAAFLWSRNEVNSVSMHRLSDTPSMRIFSNCHVLVSIQLHCLILFDLLRVIIVFLSSVCFSSHFCVVFCVILECHLCCVKSNKTSLESSSSSELLDERVLSGKHYCEDEMLSMPGEPPLCSMPVRAEGTPLR